MSPTLALLVAATVAPTALGPAPTVPPASVSTSATGSGLLVHGGRIHVNDGKGTVVEALLVQDGRVVATGPLELLLERPDADGWSRLDLDGGTAVPGLQDAHIQLETFGESLETLDLTGCEDYDELIERVAARIESGGEESDTWIVGRGWDPETWSDRTLPHHRRLSQAVPAHPVLLWSADGRSALVNRAALELAQLDGRLDPPPRLQGGRIERDDDRYATGVLVDSAVELVLEHVPEPSPEDRERRILAAQEELLALGLTCVHDMDVAPATVDVLRALRDSGALRLRVVAYLSGNDRFSSDTLEGLPEFDAADRLSLVGVSLRVDGSLHLRGAALLEDYADAPRERGHTLLSKEDLARRVAMIVGARLQPAVQAVGNHANRMVLDVYQELGAFVDGFPRLRPRIEYAQVVSPRDWPRFPALGVVPSVQALRTAQGRAWIAERLGTDRTEDCDAWRRLAPELGRPLAFGSDAPTVSPAPTLGLRAARMRDSERGQGEGGFLPYDQLDGAAALEGYTSGPAYACHQDDRRGRLLPGYAADLTVLDVDPVTCDPDELLEAQVAMTVIDGRVVYRAGP